MSKRKSSIITLKQYHAERWKNFHQHLKKYFKNESSESLHGARVETKRLTVLFRFINYCDRQFNTEKSLKSLQKIFILTGALRQYKNEDLLCGKFEITDAILKKEASKQKALKKELKARYNKYIKRLRKTEKRASAILKAVPEEKLQVYFAQILHHLNALLVKKFTADMHNNRKKIKEAVYLAKMAGSNGTTLISPTKLNLLDQLQDEIGKWHDIVSFSARLKRIKDAVVQLKLLETLEIEEKQKLKLILTLSDEFMGL